VVTRQHVGFGLPADEEMEETDVQVPERLTAMETRVDLAMADAETAVRAALAAEGFGVLTEIDVAATFRAKLGIERSPLKILGACNPTIAHTALGIDPSASLLLPCNVVLEADGSGTRVSIADPRTLLTGEDLEEVATDAATRLAAVLAALAAPASRS